MLSFDINDDDVLYNRSKFNIANIKLCRIDCKLRQLSERWCRKLKSTGRRLSEIRTCELCSVSRRSIIRTLAIRNISATRFLVRLSERTISTTYNLRWRNFLLGLFEFYIFAHQILKSLRVFLPGLELSANPHAISVKSSKRTSDSRREYRREYFGTQLKCKYQRYKSRRILFSYKSLIFFSAFSKIL